MRVLWMKSRTVSTHIHLILLTIILLGSLGIIRAESTTATLTEELTSIVNALEPTSGTIGVYVVDATTGRIIFEHNAREALIPASNNKLLTTAAALYYLGSDYSFKTPVYYTGEITKNILHGDLIVIGSGDPTISGRFHPSGDKKDVVWIFNRWSYELKKKGVLEIYGDIIGQDNYFDDDYFGKGWPAQERGEWYCAEISALSFNDNCVDVYWRGAAKAGLPAEVSLTPPTSYVNLLNGVKTVERGGSAQTSFKRDDKSNIIRAEGTIPIRRTATDWPTVYNPTAYCVTVLKETLEKNGITIKGKVYDLDDNSEKTLDENAMRLLDTYVSPPLSSIVNVINRNSQNFYAEQILKTIGKHTKGSGSFISGCSAAIDFLEKEGIYVPGTVMTDGSGLSRFNRVSPLQLVKVLQFMSKHPAGAVFFDSLPQGGTSGTLKERFQKTNEAKDVAPRIFGKTGYLGGVNSLSGMITARKGDAVYYSIIVNARGVDSSFRLDLIDRIAIALADRDYL